MKHSNFILPSEIAENTKILKSDRGGFYEFCNELLSQFKIDRASFRDYWEFSWGRNKYILKNQDFIISGREIRINPDISTTLREIYYTWVKVDAKSQISVTSYQLKEDKRRIAYGDTEKTVSNNDSAADLFNERTIKSNFSFYTSIPLKTKRDLSAVEIAEVLELSERRVIDKLTSVREAWEKFSYDLSLHSNGLYTSKPDSAVALTISPDGKFFISDGRELSVTVDMSKLGLKRDYSKRKVVMPFCVDESLIPTIFPNYKRRLASKSDGNATIPESEKEKYILRKDFLEKYIPVGFDYKSNFQPLTEFIRLEFDKIIKEGKNPYSDKSIKINYNGYPIPAYLFGYRKEARQLSFRISDDASDIIKSLPEVASKIEHTNARSKVESTSQEWYFPRPAKAYLNQKLVKLGSYSFRDDTLYEKTVYPLFASLNNWKKESNEAFSQNLPIPTVKHNGLEFSPYDIGLCNLSGQLTVATKANVIPLIFDPIENLMRAADIAQKNIIAPNGYENWQSLAQRIHAQSPKALRPFIANMLIDAIVLGLDNQTNTTEKPDYLKIKAGTKSETTVLNDRAKLETIKITNEALATSFAQMQFSIPENMAKNSPSISRF